MNKLVMLAATAPLLVSCALYTSMETRDTILMDKVKRKSAFDFQCAQEEITITKIDNGSYGAVGCGKRATYVGINKYCSVGYLESKTIEDCQVVADTFVKLKK